MRLGFSSEIYPLETADIALLPDAVDTGIDTDKFSDEIIVLLGDVKTGVDDCLLPAEPPPAAEYSSIPGFL